MDVMEFENVSLSKDKSTTQEEKSSQSKPAVTKKVAKPGDAKTRIWWMLTWTTVLTVVFGYWRRYGPKNVINDIIHSIAPFLESVFIKWHLTKPIYWRSLYLPSAEDIGKAEFGGTAIRSHWRNVKKRHNTSCIWIINLMRY